MAAPGANVNQAPDAHDLAVAHAAHEAHATAAPATSGRGQPTLRDLLYQAGFRGTALDTAYGIALAESGGNAQAHNGNASTGDDSYGLFQINMLGAMGPERLKEFGLTSASQLYDPLTNAKVAYALSKGGTNFNPWTTYTSGAYKAHLGTADSPVTNSAGSTAAAVGTSSPQSAADYSAKVSWSMAVIDSSPELMSLFKEGMANGWDAGRFAAAVQGTDWYKDQSSAQREWDILRLSDPATAAARVAERTQLIQQTASSLGISLSKNGLGEIVSQSLSMGLNTAQIQGDIASKWAYNKNVAQTGLAGQTIDKLRTAANDYMVPLSDQTINAWTEKVLAGNATADDFTEYAKQQSASMFPVWSQQIKSGLTAQQLADPYRQTAAQLLGIDPNSVNFMDPKWRALIDTVDPKTGQHVPLSLADAQTQIRSNPTFGYDQSANGRQTAAQLTTQLAQAFGAI